LVAGAYLDGCRAICVLSSSVLTSRWRIDGKTLARFPRLSSSVMLVNNNENIHFL